MKNWNGKRGADAVVYTSNTLGDSAAAQEEDRKKQLSAFINGIADFFKGQQNV